MLLLEMLDLGIKVSLSIESLSVVQCSFYKKQNLHLEKKIPLRHFAEMEAGCRL